MYLLFTLEQHTKLFALTKIEGTTETGRSSSNTSIDTVLDSSRYFVTKILQATTTNTTSSRCTTQTPTRTALLGFGFRDREIALDLLGNVQQFQRSIQRELEAQVLHEKFTAIPQLGTYDKIHIASMPGSQSNRGSCRRRTTTTTTKTPSTTKKKKSGGGGGVLVKKPPPGAGVAMTTASDPIPPSHKEGHRTKIDHDHTNPHAAGTGAAGTVAAATAEEEEEDFGDFQDGQAIITTTAATTATAVVLDEDARLDQEIEEVFEEFQL